MMSTSLQTPDPTAIVDTPSTDSNDASARIIQKKTLALPKLSSQSLASMMTSRRRAMKSLQIQFAAQMAQSRKVKFEMKETSEDPVEPPAKRRRFQRRNSKTSAMLFSSMASLVPDPLPTTQATEEGGGSSKATKVSSSDDVWDGGIEIAEELVRHLKLRRQKLANNGA